MPTSSKEYKLEIKDYIKNNFPNKNTTILDVGAGEGTYYNLLGNYYERICAIEIFEPNIRKYNLREKYEEVLNVNIVDARYNWFDLIIFGDIIEHLTILEAKQVLNYAYDRCEEMIVAVPYRYKQGEVDGNKYEIHIQDDLTPEIMKERYPYLELLYGNDEYGYYIKKKGKNNGKEKNK